MPDLMSTPIEKLTFEDVVEFCKHQTPENIRLEYKQGFSGKDIGLQVAKEAAAFANTQGGIIIWGVEEHSQRDRRPKPDQLGMDLGGDPRQTVVNACAHEVYPPITPELSDYLRNPDDDARGFLLVSIRDSQDIHTVERRSGIYIRLADHNKPMPATLEQIAWLLERRQRAADTQKRRRSRAIERLKVGLGAAPIQRHIWVTLGPAITIDPLFELRTFRACAAEFSVPSACSGRRPIPIPSEYDMRSLDDAAYYIDAYLGCGRTAGLIDLYGNVALCTDVCGPVRLAPEEIPDDLVKLVPKDKEGATVGIKVAVLVERILATTRVARNIYEACGYIGLVEFQYTIEGIRGTPLVFDTGHRDNLLGACALDSCISAAKIVLSSDLRRDPLEFLHDDVHRGLWAWGHKRATDEDVVRVIDAAEQLHYGAELCRCKKWHYPRSREACLECRGTVKSPR